MALITDIIAPQRGSRRRVVWVDHNEWRTTTSDALALAGLRMGRIQPDDELAASLDAAEVRAARDRALRLLTYRDRSARELTDRLTRDGYPRSVASTLVEDLRRVGLVDDERFAESMAHVLTRVRGYGRVRALRELDSRGIDSEMATDALAKAFSKDDEEASARLLARALAARPNTSVDRVAARLARKGFSIQLSLKAAREAVASTEDEASDLHLLDD